MKKLVLVLALLVASTSAQATAFLKYEYVSGMNKVCVYDDMGSEVAITINSYELCPLTI